MTDLLYISNNIHISDNLLPKAYTFEVDSTFNSVSGSGTTNYSTIRYKGTRSLQIINLDYQNDDYALWLTDKQIVPLVNGQALFSFFVNTNNTENIDCAIEMYFGGVLAETYNFTIDVVNNPFTDTNEWHRYAQSFTTYIGQDISFKFIVKKNTSSVFTDKSILFDGLKLELDNKGVGLPTAYVMPNNIVLELSDTLDFPNVGSNATESITIPFLGAEENDFIQMSYSFNIGASGLIFSSYVSNIDEITILAHNHTGSSVNPPSGIFKFKIVK